jgi:hypothetical protein
LKIRASCAVIAEASAMKLHLPEDSVTNGQNWRNSNSDYNCQMFTGNPLKDYLAN